MAKIESGREWEFWVMCCDQALALGGWDLIPFSFVDIWHEAVR